MMSIDPSFAKIIPSSESILKLAQGWNLMLALVDRNIGKTSVNAPASHPAVDLIKSRDEWTYLSCHPFCSELFITAVFCRRLRRQHVSPIKAHFEWI